MQTPIDDPAHLPSVADAVLRLTVATVIGAAIGLDRELRGKPAGLRTHGLVALGSALVTLVSVHFAFAGVVADGNAVTRTVQGIIAGVGFLGGGVILKTTEQGTVQGLTTAATIWLVACLGIAAGAGLWVLTTAGAAVTFLLLVFGGPFERWVRRHVAGRRRSRRGDRHRRLRRHGTKRRPLTEAEREANTEAVREATGRAERRPSSRKADREANEEVPGMPPGTG